MKEILPSAVNKNLGDLRLEFIERDCSNMHYTVVMECISLRLLNDKHFVLYGKLTLCNTQTYLGYIEYDFASKTFYRVRCSAGDNVRRISPLIIDPHCVDTIEWVLTYLSA